MSIEFLRQLSQGLCFEMPPSGGMWLHIGGKLRVPGWTVLDISAGPHVDIVSDCTDLGAIADGSCSVVYCSHVYEHLGYDDALPRALAECHRVLAKGGVALISVPNLENLCKLFLDPSLTVEEQHRIMQVMYGGRTDPYDVHLCGFSDRILDTYLRKAGFRSIFRIGNFGLFPDASVMMFRDVPISLNMVALR
jgi:predicted SAM-dependent methyltransferase